MFTVRIFLVHPGSVTSKPWRPGVLINSDTEYLYKHLCKWLYNVIISSIGDPKTIKYITFMTHKYTHQQCFNAKLLREFTIRWGVGIKYCPTICNVFTSICLRFFCSLWRLCVILGLWCYGLWLWFLRRIQVKHITWLLRWLGTSWAVWRIYIEITIVWNNYFIQL